MGWHSRIVQQYFFLKFTQTCTKNRYIVTCSKKLNLVDRFLVLGNCPT